MLAGKKKYRQRVFLLLVRVLTIADAMAVNDMTAKNSMTFVF